MSNLPQILSDVLDRPEADRSAFLDGACGSNASLRAEVEALIKAHEDADSFLAKPLVTGPAAAATIPITITEQPGTVIDKYKLLQLIGEGGFGAVYMAEQREPVKRRVALKIIKLGMDTKQVIARFEAERQALAMMDHPNIARVLDAGATETGRPYFVMELVKGVSITEYCDTENLTTKQRLDLFISVCHAVQHAHQKGIIHRDLKPSNVMVTLHDGKPVPKVIDFGIAKATNQELTSKTLFTEYRQFIGTPEYMSPEQAQMSGLDIDTRSDIYSLGVLLYELLTGVTPFDGKRLRSAAINEIQRIIREEEPSRPSTRLSELSHISLSLEGGGQGVGEGSTESKQSSIQYIAKHRRTNPSSLSKQLRGDLDWIIMKALEKDRSRRYETSNGFALDIERYLNDEPVLASPPSASYRLSKFVRRNRTSVMAAALVVLALAAGAVGVTFGLVQAVQSEALAMLEADKAKTEKAIAEAVNDFLNDDLLAAVAPSVEAGRGRDVLMREVLDEAAKRIEDASAPGGRFADKPLVEASIRAALGSTYRLLGEYPAAEPHLERARLLRRRELGEEHPSTLNSMNDLASQYWDQGRYEESERLNIKTLEIRKRILGEEHPDTLGSMINLANLYLWQGRYADAEPLIVKALEIQKRILGEEHPDTLRSMGTRASLYMVQARYAEAEPLFVKVLEIQKRILGEEHPDTLGSMGNLASLHADLGRYAKSEQLCIKTLQIQKRILGEEHPDTLKSMHNLAVLYQQHNRNEEAEQLYLQAIEIKTRVLGEEHPSTLVSIGNLAAVYKNQGLYDKAESLLLKTLEIKKRVLDEEDPSLLATITILGNLYGLMERYEEAAAMFKTSLPIKRRVLGMGHPWTGHAMDGLAQAYEALGRHEDALPLYRELLDLQLARVDDPDADAGTLNDAAWSLLTQEFEELRDPDRALPLAQRACAQEEANDGTNLWMYLDTHALALHMTGDTQQAIKTQQRAIALIPDGADKTTIEELETNLRTFEEALK